MAERMQRLARTLLEPVDAAGVAAFRIVFGALMLFATVRFVAKGWIADYYEKPTHFFHYKGFAWIEPWAHPGMYIHFAVMAALCVLIILGIRARIASAAFGALFAYAHLIDKTNYLNHYYLVICICAVMACVPLDRGFTHVPRWVLWLLRAQVGVVYVFGGIAKLKGAWLFDAQPLTIWLSANTDFPILGRWFAEPWTAYVFSWAGLIFDLSIVPLLLWGRTRPFAYAAVIGFHVITARLFNLGMFPWMMIGCSIIFLPSDWPRRFFAAGPTRTAETRRPRLVFAALAVYAAFHVLMPLRHLVIPGEVTWTEEGFRFAWHVMVMEKDGSVVLHVREPATDRRWVVRPRSYLTRYQTKQMSTQPDMILELAHIVAADYRARGVRDPEVTVDAFVSLNGSPRARLIDPTVDLARVSDTFGHASWILPAPGARGDTTLQRFAKGSP